MPDFAAVGRDGEPLIPADSHVALAHPPPTTATGSLRRGYNYTDGSDGLGRLDAGLFFLAYQRDIEAQFVPMQLSLKRSDLMNEYVKYLSSASVRHPARGAGAGRLPRTHDVRGVMAHLHTGPTSTGDAMTSRTFCTAIKERTAAAHERAESHVFIRALLSGQLNVRALVLMMESLVPVYDEPRPACARRRPTPPWRCSTIGGWTGQTHLRDDLRGLGRREPVAVGSASSAYAVAIRESAQSPQRLLAHHYTRYLGDLAGGQAIARLVQRHYEVPADLLSYYDFRELGDLAHYRKQYKAILDLVPWSPTQQAEFITECQVGFEASRRVFADLAIACGLEAAPGAVAPAFLASERAHAIASAPQR